MGYLEPTENIVDVAFHETGHFLSAYRQGLRLQGKGITIEPGDGYLGRVSIKWHPGKSDRSMLTVRDRLRMERFVMACLASQVVRKRQRPETCTEKEFRADLVHVTDALDAFEIEGREADAFTNWLRVRTEKFFARPILWVQVETLARALVERKTLSAKAAIEIANEAAQRWLDAERANPTPWTEPPRESFTKEELEEAFRTAELRAMMRG